MIHQHSKLKIPSIIPLVLIFCLMVIVPVKTKADSGWDSDYDIGGSWDSGSSWDYGDSWDSGSSWDNDYDYDSSPSWSSGGSHINVSGDGFSFDFLVVIIVLVVIIFLSRQAINPSKHHRHNEPAPEPKQLYKDISLDTIKQIDPTIDITKFKVHAFQIYKDIQTAWMNFDTDTIRKLTTDELYNMYKSQLETLKLKNEQNIMDDIEYLNASIIDIQEDNGLISIELYLNVTCYDYVINTTTNEVTRGSKDNKLDIEYKITLVKSSTNNNKIEKCPNCGAPVDIVSSSTCPYCDSTLVKDASEYVISKKQFISQRYTKK